LDKIQKLIINKIDEMKDRIIRFHQKIIQIPSENPPGKYKEISIFVENKMKNIGLDTKNIRNNVIGKLHNKDGASLILYSHMDTVPVSIGWTKNPLGGEIIKNKIYGRGACDDKACVTASIFAMKAIIDLGIELNGTVILTSVIDEEAGGFKGINYLLNKEIIKGDACLLGDGRGSYPAAYFGGCIIISFHIEKKQINLTNSSNIPKNYNYSSENPIQKMTPVLNFLIEMQEEFNKLESKYPNYPSRHGNTSILLLSKIQGGEKISNLPKRCSLYCVIYTIPEQDVKSIKSRILKFVEDLNRKNPDLNIKVQIPLSFEPYIADVNSKFARIVKKSAKNVFNEEREYKYFIKPTDSHFFTEKGIETLLFGTGSIRNNLHAPDEFIEIDDLINTTKMFASVIVNYLG